MSLFYRTNEAVSMYRTSNQTYGSRAPTVHEMPVRESQTCQDEVPSRRTRVGGVRDWDSIINMGHLTHVRMGQGREMVGYI